MPNPLRVSLENIIPLTEARDHFSQIINEVQKDKLYVLTKGGKPAVAIIDVKYLEAITGGNVNQNYIKEEIKKAPEKVGLAPMIEHKTPSIPPPPVVPKPFTPPSPMTAPNPPKPFAPPAPTPKPITPAIPPPPPTPPTPPAPKPPTPQASVPLAPTPPPLPKSPTPPSTMPASPAPLPTTPTPSVAIPTPIPVSTPPPPTNNPAPATAPTAPANTNAVIETSNNPFATKQQTVQAIQPAQPTPISVNFSPDYNEKEMKNPPGQAAPEDKPGPAQYAGSSTAAGGNANKEPDDMAID